MAEGRPIVSGSFGFGCYSRKPHRHQEIKNIQSNPRHAKPIRKSCVAAVAAPQRIPKCARSRCCVFVRMADGSSTAAGNDESEAGAYRNPIWNYFLKVPPGNEARCLKCKAVLKTPTGTTTTLATHLKRHPDSYKTFECERQARGSAVKHKNGSKPNHQQPSVADSFKPKLKPTAPKAKQMTAIIANFIASGMHPYSIVEESGFIEMMKLAMPDYTVPSRTTFSRVVIPDLYESKKKELRKSLRDIFSSGAECYSITTDGWTSRANNSYVSVTCHVMDKEFG